MLAMVSSLPRLHGYDRDILPRVRVDVRSAGADPMIPHALLAAAVGLVAVWVWGRITDSNRGR